MTYLGLPALPHGIYGGWNEWYKLPGWLAFCWSRNRLLRFVLLGRARMCYGNTFYERYSSQELKGNISFSSDRIFHTFFISNTLRMAMGLPSEVPSVRNIWHSSECHSSNWILNGYSIAGNWSWSWSRWFVQNKGFYQENMCERFSHGGVVGLRWLNIMPTDLKTLNRKINKMKQFTKHRAN